MNAEFKRKNSQKIKFLESLSNRRKYPTEGEKSHEFHLGFNTEQ